MTAEITRESGENRAADERRRRQDRRAEVVDAARAHSEAVTRHLDRLAARVRSAAPPGSAGVPRMPRLPELSTLLLADASPGSLLRTVLALAAAAVPGADGVSITLERGGRIETAAASEQPVADADRAQYDLRDGPCLQALETGGTVLEPNMTGARWPAFADRAHALGWAGVLAVPLSVRGVPLGALNVYSRRPEALGPGALAAAEALAEQVAVALTNARDFRRQQDLAAALQRSLLPTELPTVPGLGVAAVYRPATSGINVGGDWYDVLPLPEGRVALVVGDVGGHGIDAATTMGQLRVAVQAYVLEGHPPARVLELVDAFLTRLDAEAFATCLVLVVDPRIRTAEWSTAGHLGPVLVVLPGSPPGHEQTVRDLSETGRTAALGAPLPVGSRSEAGHGVLPPGFRMLLFTDGLVERRGESLDAGLGRLAAAAGEGLALPLERWCDAVVAAQLDGREVDDDVAVLAVEMAGPGAVPTGSSRVDP